MRELIRAATTGYLAVMAALWIWFSCSCIFDLLTAGSWPQTPSITRGDTVGALIWGLISGLVGGLLVLVRLRRGRV